MFHGPVFAGSPYRHPRHQGETSPEATIVVEFEKLFTEDLIDPYKVAEVLRRAVKLIRHYRAEAVEPKEYAQPAKFFMLTATAKVLVTPGSCTRRYASTYWMDAATAPDYNSGEEYICALLALSCLEKMKNQLSSAQRPRRNGDQLLIDQYEAALAEARRRVCVLRPSGRKHSVEEDEAPHAA